MLGRTPPATSAPSGRCATAIITPTSRLAEAMLRYFIARAHNRRTLVKPRIVICVPFGITEVEKRAVKESAESAGAREVFLIEEPMAAAIGAGLPNHRAFGKHGRRHRWRHHRSRGHSARGHRVLAERTRRRRQDGRRHPGVLEAQVQPGHSASKRPSASRCKFLATRTRWTSNSPAK